MIGNSTVSMKALLFLPLILMANPVVAIEECTDEQPIITSVQFQVKQPLKIVTDYMKKPWFSFIYVPTKEKTIRKYLTFKEGDKLDMTRVSESIRKLRHEKFIWDAHYEVEKLDPCHVAIKVTVHDTFPFKPKISVSRRSSTNKSSIGVTHTNLFGTGSKLQFDYKQGKLRDQKVLQYVNPNFGKEHYYLSSLYSDNSDGKASNFVIKMPFNEFDSVHQYGLEYQYFKGDLSIYDQTQVSQLIPYTQQDNQIEYALGGTGQFGLQRKRTYWYINQDNTRYQDFSQLDRDIISVGGIYQLFDVDYIEVKNIRNMAKTEDYNQGATISFEAAYLYDRVTKTEGELLGLNYNQNFLFDEWTLLQTDLSFKKYFFDNHLADQQTKGKLQFNAFDKGFSTSWNVKLEFEINQNPKLENYILMDEEFPIRGFPYGYRAGDSYASINIEKRWFNLARYFGVIDIAMIAFYDAGFIAVNDSLITQYNKESLQSLGVGLRISPTKLTHNTVIHIDLAYPINEKNLDQNYQLNIFGVGYF